MVVRRRIVVSRVAPLAPLRELRLHRRVRVRIQRHARVVGRDLIQGPRQHEDAAAVVGDHRIQRPALPHRAPQLPRRTEASVADGHEGVQGMRAQRADEVRAGVGVLPRRSGARRAGNVAHGDLDPRFRRHRQLDDDVAGDGTPTRPIAVRHAAQVRANRINHRRSQIRARLDVAWRPSSSFFVLARPAPLPLLRRALLRSLSREKLAHSGSTEESDEAGREVRL